MRVGDSLLTKSTSYFNTCKYCDHNVLKTLKLCTFEKQQLSPVLNEVLCLSNVLLFLSFPS